ncbi:MAG: hypothetical protein ACE5O2_06725 [Armatimonadota bacterium]
MRTCCLPCVVFLTVAPCILFAADPATQPFSYHEGWEGEPPQVTLWARNGPSTVNFIGPSEEQAFEGKKSLKLDVTLDGGTYHYWGAQVRVPCEGRLKLSARILVAEGTTARVGFGTNMVYPPTHHSGCGPAEVFYGPTGGWRLVEEDLVARGRTGRDRVLRQHTGNLSGEDAGTYLDRWAIFIYGGKGKRAIVYVDDVRIEGEVPSEADYQRDIEVRWRKARQRFAQRIEAWRRDLAAGQAATASVSVPPGSLAERIKNGARQRADEASALIDRLEKTGYGSPGDVQQIQAAVHALKFTPQMIEAIVAARAAGTPFLLYAPRAITNDRLLPDSFPIPAPVARELACSACPGEYESVSLAVYAMDDIEGLRLSPTDLAGPDGVIPAAAVDVKVVKCWYQAGRGIHDLTGRILVPELLVKDDALVRVDVNERHNYLRSTAPSSSSGLRSESPTSADQADTRAISGSARATRREPCPSRSRCIPSTCSLPG